MPPTIAIDIRVLGSLYTSGIQEYADRLLERLIPLDPAIRYRLFYSGRSPLRRRAWMEESNVRLYETGISNRLLWMRTRLTDRPYLDRLVGGADVFFFPHFLPGAVSSDCRRILTVHDLSFENFPEFFSLTRRLWHGFSVHPRKEIARADRVIAVSESTRRDIVNRYGINPDRVTTIVSGIRTPDQHYLNVGASSRTILMLGTIEPRKNVEGVIAAFERLGPGFDDVKLIIAGPKGWLWRPILRVAMSSPVRDRILFLDYVDDAERRRLLSSATLLVYPSFMEGFGFPPLEAMTHGTPTIIGANSSMLQICGDAALAVNPYSITQLSSAVAVILTDDRLRTELMQRGYRQAQRYSWQQTAQETLGVMLQ